MIGALVLALLDFDKIFEVSCDVSRIDIRVKQVADTLSKWVALLNIIHAQVMIFVTFLEIYSEDPSFGYIYANLMDKGERDNFLLVNGFLLRGLYLCVLDCFLW
jgi:hypothetical protein